VLRPLLVALFVTALTTAGAATPALPPAETPPASVLINELANGGVRSDSDTFFELRNWGASSVDLSGWNVYRCNGMGLRSNVGAAETPLAGVVLAPGQIFTVSKVGMPGDAHVSQPFANGGFGLYLEAPGGRVADAVGVYPNTPWPTESECSRGRNLPNRLDYALGESWQRVAATGNVDTDFIAAASTSGLANASAPTKRAASGVVVSELAPSGTTADDEFVELQNTGQSVADIGGWQLFRCTATGRARPDTLQYTAPAGTKLRPGARWVIAGPGFVGREDARYSTPLADIATGVLLQTAKGAIVDRVAISAHDDSACQDGDDKLPAILDAVAGESYQRHGAGFLIAPRTPGRTNATVESSLFRSSFGYQAGQAEAGQAATPQGVAISELATDPAQDELPAGAVQRNYVELGNYGTKTVDIGGWSLRRCDADGVRSRELQAAIPKGTTLRAGQTYRAARAGTAAATGANATYPVSFNMLGTGVWLADAHGTRVDSVGVYQANEMDASNVVDSPCTKGVALTTYLPDRMLGETFLRSRFTGVDADDFVTGAATPGAIDRVAWADPAGAVVARVPAPTPEVRAAEPPATGTATGATVLEAWSGSSGAPLATRSGAGETRLDEAAPAPSENDGWDFPYQRFVLDASALSTGSMLDWTGSTAGRNEVQLSVWNEAAGRWRLLDAAAGTGTDKTGPDKTGTDKTGTDIRLSGAVKAGDIDRGRVSLLVQSGPRTKATLADKPDGAPEKPNDYDFAISHITDTQYLSESYPEVYAQEVSWIAANAEPRKIAFATHTGDLVQNWVDPDQNPVRARREYDRASANQAILDKAGVPNSVLPGNHDSKRGVDFSLFNEYFGPGRYAASASYGGSIAPGDNRASFNTFERSGARFLMLSLPYAYGEREIAWAESIVRSHPHHNVIVSTHEHVTPKTQFDDAERSTSSRWVSRGDELWDRVVAPNRNVVAVLSGHFHGLGKIVTENAGGIAGHNVVELLADYQEFRTHTGERATGFQRLLQVDLASATIAVDTFSVRLDKSASYEYDYPQFVADNGLSTTMSNVRPWRLVEAGPQGRYTAADDEFSASVTFQFDKRVDTVALTTDRPATVNTSSSAPRAHHGLAAFARATWRR
jgi:hypothetical protein